MRRPGHTDQNGIVSIMVTLIMMIVISLIVIGFSQVARRNQREALDRQLSTQAYYAAESGVNQAAAFFHNNPSVGNIDTLSPGDCKTFINNQPTDATPGLGIGYGSGNVLNNGVSYSCLMVNSYPASLVADPLGQDSNLVWHVKDSAGNPFSFLTFSWASNPDYADTNTCTSTAGGTLPTYTSWNCAFGILRVDIIASANVNNAGLEDPSLVRTVYMVPNGFNAANPATATASPLAGQATIAKTPCSSVTDVCSVKLTGLNQSEYYVRLTMMYQDSSNVSLVGGDVSNPVGGVKFADGQAVIDATGKAQDELRRVQVRIPLIRTDSVLPIFGVQSTNSVCKELTVVPGSGTDVGADCK